MNIFVQELSTMYLLIGEQMEPDEMIDGVILHFCIGRKDETGSTALPSKGQLDYKCEVRKNVNEKLSKEGYLKNAKIERPEVLYNFCYSNFCISFDFTKLQQHFANSAALSRTKHGAYSITKNKPKSLEAPNLIKNPVDGVDGGFPEQRGQVCANVPGRHSGHLPHVQPSRDVEAAAENVQDGLASVDVRDSNRNFTEKKKSIFLISTPPRKTLGHETKSFKLDLLTQDRIKKVFVNFKRME